MKRFLAAVIGLLCLCLPAFAHPGSTDAYGGHTDRSTGKYHYHHGYSAHQHVDGQCPYDFDDKTGESSDSSSGTSSKSKSILRPTSTPKGSVQATSSPPKPPEKEVTIVPIGMCIFAGITIIFLAILLHKLSIKRLRQKYEAKIRQDSDVHELLIANERAKFTSYKETLDKERQSLLQELHASRPPAEIESKIEAILNRRTKPDVSLGVVYIRRDLSGNTYHHRMSCDRDLVLVAKKTALFLDLTPCSCCSYIQQPLDDVIVLSSSSSSEVFHSADVHCPGVYGKQVRLSEMLAYGRRPCKRCNPPTELPKVWY